MPKVENKEDVGREEDYSMYESEGYEIVDKVVEEEESVSEGLIVIGDLFFFILDVLDIFF